MTSPIFQGERRPLYVIYINNLKYSRLKFRSCHRVTLTFNSNRESLYLQIVICSSEGLIYQLASPSDAK